MEKINFKGRHYIMTVQRNWLKKVKIAYFIIDNANVFVNIQEQIRKKRIRKFL